ncbi:S-layer homology domain-containing protein [Paenibacillus cymbidii]|uniref:S-layer homology domain-containing protein n=1 Tax=Paenibacillus cymbidii TaxID=1639034 RepID=UPI001080C1A8|nr:S-layer homology domain-containing protein [Paenibacillus cymbidii]
MRVKGFELAAGFVLLASIAVGAAGGGAVGHAAAGAGQGQTAGAGITASGVFSDLAGHWAASSVSDAVYQGYVDGYLDGTFKPEQSVTRAEFVKMAMTALKLPLGPAGGVWYDTYVRGAVSAGMYKYDFASGTWDDPITREEMAMLAVRAAVKDVRDAVAFDQKKYMYAATKAGLIQGMDDTGMLGMDQPTTRAQSVTIIERILTVNSGGKLVADKYAISNAELAWHKTNIFTVMPEFFKMEEMTADGQWNPNNLFVETTDGNYRGELDALVAIDLADPNDPNRRLLPELNKMQWYKWTSKTVGYPVKDYPNSYVLIYQSHVDYNTDKNVYVESNHISKSLSGLESPEDKDQAFMNGELNRITSIFLTKDGDTEAYIIPKIIAANATQIDISIYAPARPPADIARKTLLIVRPRKE